MEKLQTMRNIGREMARKLTAAGVPTPEDLRAMGAEEAYFRLKTLYPQVCLVHLYALEGAVRDVEFNALPAARKQELKAFSDALRGSSR